LKIFREARREFERAYIERVLAETGGNVTAPPNVSGCTARAFSRNLKT